MPARTVKAIIIRSLLLIFLPTISVNGFAEPGDLKWIHSTSGEPEARLLDASPAVSSKGTIYIGTQSNQAPGFQAQPFQLYSLDPSGILNWSNPIVGELSTTAIAIDGTVYFSSSDNQLYAIHPNGSVEWSYQVETTRFASSGKTFNPSIGIDGTLYIGSTDGNLYAIDATGTLKWSYSVIVRTAPAIGPDGTIYVLSNTTGLHAINPDGTRKWSYMASLASNEHTPAIGSDGTVYVASKSGLYAVNKDGQLEWLYAATADLHSSPSIGVDGTVYVGLGHNLHAVNSDGTPKWLFSMGHFVTSSPAIGADGTIYAGSSDTNLYAINPNGTLSWTYETQGEITSSPTIGADGTVYVGSSDGNLYAIEGNSGGLARSPWPVFRGNPQRTGRSSNLVEGFVTRFYLVGLGRQPERAGLADWTQQLNDQTKTGTDVAVGFIFSPEFTNRNLDNSRFVDILYETFFDRTADSQGKNDWITLLTAGTSRVVVLEGFTNSQEFSNLAATYGIKPRRTAIENFVTRFYRQILQREPDPAGLADWSQALANGSKNGTDIADGFIASQEFTIRSLTNTEFINIMYRAFFGREADPAGLAHWLQVLNSNSRFLDREFMVERFIESQEYLNLLDQYGIYGAGSIASLIKTSIPGKMFANCLQAQSVKYIRMLSSLDCRGYAITDVTGLRHLTNLESLNLDDNELSAIDVSANTQLSWVTLSNNKLETVNLHGASALYSLNLQGNLLNSLDVSSSTQLFELELSDNQFVSISLSGATSLNRVNLNNNQLTSIDVSGATELKTLDLDNNQLTTFDPAAATTLSNLSLNNNLLTSVDVSNNALLSKLQADSNQLESIDLSANTLLAWLSLNNNQLTNIDVGASTGLRHLSLDDNQLTTIDLRENILLGGLIGHPPATVWGELSLDNNQLTTLDVSASPNLSKVYLNNNLLDSVDFSGNPSLWFLSMSDNQLTTFDSSELTRLLYLYLNNNHLSRIDVSSVSQLRELFLIDNTQIPCSDIQLALAQHPELILTHSIAGCAI